MNHEGLAKDAFMMATPEDPYKLCPCGCGKKWRYVIRDGEFEKHEQTFVDNWLKTNAQKE